MLKIDSRSELHGVKAGESRVCGPLICVVSLVLACARVAWMIQNNFPARASSNLVAKPSTNGIVVRAGNVKLMGSTSAGSSPGSARIFVLGHGEKN